MSLLFIVERNLRNQMGHFPGQIRAISQFSSAVNIHVITRSGTERLPFSALPDRQPERIKLHSVLVSQREAAKSKNPVSLATADAQNVIRIASEMGAVSSDTIIIPSGAPHDLRVALLIAVNDGPQIVVRILALSHFNVLTTAEIKELRIQQKADRIHLSCETEEMSQAVSDHFDLDCRADFILPCNVLPNDGVPNRAQNGTFRAGMLGGPRSEKGSFRLPAIVRLIAKKSREMDDPPKITIVVQASLKLQMRTLTMLWHLLRAKLTPGNPQIEIIWGAQSNENYRAALFSLDCVLVPYRLDRYSTSGSGVIIDAVNAAIPIIRTHGMAMSKLMSVGNSIEVTKDDEIAAAILRMAVNPAPFFEATKHARSALQARVNQLPFK